MECKRRTRKTKTPYRHQRKGDTRSATPTRTPPRLLVRFGPFGVTKRPLRPRPREEGVLDTR